MELWWYLSRPTVIVRVRGDVEEYQGCPEMLLDCCLLHLQISFS
jgi:hypothetical protein